MIIYHAILAIGVPTIGGTAGFVRLRRSIAARGPLLEAVPTGGAGQPGRPADADAAAAVA